MARKKGEVAEFSMLGWCSDGYHEQCMITTVSGIKCECPCENHGTNQPTFVGMSPLLKASFDKFYHSSGKLKKPSEIEGVLED